MIPAVILISLAGWTAAAESTVTVSASGRQPRVAVGTNGMVAAVWGETDLSRTVPGAAIVCRVSPDGGKSWNPPSTIAWVDRLAIGMRRGPQIAVAGSSIAVLAISHADGDVLAWKSSDHGISWTGPVAVNDAPGSAKEGLHAVAESADGSLLAVWLDHRGSGMEVRSARSADGGSTWDANVLVYASPAGHVCECCHPFVTGGAGSSFHVLFRNWLDGSRDIWTAASLDGGRTYEPAMKLGTGTWPLEGCPMAGPWAAAGTRGLETVWKREGTLFASRPGARETRLADADQPVVASDRRGVWRMWTRDKHILLLAPGKRDATSLAPGVWPAAAGSPDGLGPVIAAWQSASDTGGVSVRILSPRR